MTFSHFNGILTHIHSNVSHSYTTIRSKNRQKKKKKKSETKRSGTNTNEIKIKIKAHQKEKKYNRQILRLLRLQNLNSKSRIDFNTLTHKRTPKREEKKSRRISEEVQVLIKLS